MSSALSSSSCATTVFSSFSYSRTGFAALAFLGASAFSAAAASSGVFALAARFALRSAVLVTAPLAGEVLALAVFGVLAVRTLGLR